MGLAETIGVTFFLFMTVAGLGTVLWTIGRIIADAVWFGQDRWEVWYPPTQVGNHRMEAMWSGRSSYWRCKNYAEIFGGTVYRVR